MVLLKREKTNCLCVVRTASKKRRKIDRKFVKVRNTSGICRNLSRKSMLFCFFGKFLTSASCEKKSNQFNRTCKLVYSRTKWESVRNAWGGRGCKKKKIGDKYWLWCCVCAFTRQSIIDKWSILMNDWLKKFFNEIACWLRWHCIIASARYGTNIVMAQRKLTTYFTLRNIFNHGGGHGFCTFRLRINNSMLLSATFLLLTGLMLCDGICINVFSTPFNLPYWFLIAFYAVDSNYEYEISRRIHRAVCWWWENWVIQYLQQQCQQRRRRRWRQQADVRWGNMRGDIKFKASIAYADEHANHSRNE